MSAPAQTLKLPAGVDVRQKGTFKNGNLAPASRESVEEVEELLSLTVTSKTFVAETKLNSEEVGLHGEGGMLAFQVVTSKKKPCAVLGTTVGGEEALVVAMRSADRSLESSKFVELKKDLHSALSQSLHLTCPESIVNLHPVFCFLAAAIGNHFGGFGDDVSLNSATQVFGKGRVFVGVVPALPSSEESFLRKLPMSIEPWDCSAEEKRAAANQWVEFAKPWGKLEMVLPFLRKVEGNHSALDPATKAAKPAKPAAKAEKAEKAKPAKAAAKADKAEKEEKADKEDKAEKEEKEDKAEKAAVSGKKRKGSKFVLDEAAEGSDDDSEMELDEDSEQSEESEDEDGHVVKKKKRIVDSEDEESMEDSDSGEDDDDDDDDDEMVESDDEDDMSDFIEDDSKPAKRKNLVKGAPQGAEKKAPKEKKEKKGAYSDGMRQTTLVAPREDSQGSAVTSKAPTPEKATSAPNGPAHQIRQRVACSANVALDACEACMSIPLSQMEAHKAAVNAARSEMVEYGSKDYKYATKNYDLIESLVKVISVQNVIMSRYSNAQMAKEAQATTMLATSLIDACDNLPAISKVHEQLLASAEAVNKLLAHTRSLATSVTAATESLAEA